MTSLRDYDLAHIDPVRIVKSRMKRTNGVLLKGTGTHARATLRRAAKGVNKPAGMRMQHDVDPALDLLAKLGDLKGIEVLNNYVLYAIYDRPKVTKGGIHLTDNTTSEDEYQGKAGLVVKIGPLVNVDAAERGVALTPGMWIAVRPSDGWAIKVNGVLCRMIVEKGIHMVVPEPDSVW